MITQTVVWTLLPDPAKPVQLILVASPRLSNTTGTVGVLSDYREMLNWPGVLTGLAVEVMGPQGTVTVSATLLGDPPDGQLWPKIFPADLPVIPFRFNASSVRNAETPFLSYPVRSLHDSVAEQYSLLLGKDSPGPGLGTPGQQKEALWSHVDRLVRLVGDHDAPPTLVRASLDDAQPGDPDGWARFAIFHRPPGADGPRPAAPAPQPPDFHKIFASLADHPVLLERLGLVRQVKITLPAGLAQGVAVRIRAVPSHVPAVVDYRPHTRCVVRDGLLRLAAADGREAPLHLPLDNPDVFTVFDVDTDAAGLSLKAYGENLARLSRSDPPPPLRLPALSSDGIFVAEANRQVRFQQAVLRASGELQADLASGGDGDQAVISAGDVQHGHRVDVFDEASRRWYPLCRRTGSYQIRGTSISVPFDDEATVSDATVEAGSDDTPVNLLHQSVFRWNGWSMAVPPPGGMLDLDDKVTPPTTGTAASPQAPFTMASHVPPGTLPSLRYGRSYRFRARLVDIAGRSLGFDPAAEAAAPTTPTRVCHRYEPVPAPVLVARRAVSEGESQTVLVVRTDNSNLEAGQLGQACERHVLPPKAAVITLERHGVLDVAGQNRLDPQAYQLLFDRDKGRVTGSADPGALGTAFVDADSMALPWLPDPLARGLALNGLPGHPGLTFEWPSGGSWHERRPMRLVLIPGSDTTTVSVDHAARVVKVTLERGKTVKTALSSHLLQADLWIMGPWRWFVQSGLGSAAELAHYAEEAIRGRISQLTPSTEIRLIHAVRRPLKEPVIANFSLERAPSETSFLFIDDRLIIHPSSTMSVHVEAIWSELVDDPARDDPQNPGPVTVSGRMLLELDADERQQTWSENTVSPEVRFKSRGQFGDTRARKVYFTPVATSRYGSFFAQRKTIRLTWQTPVPVAAAGFVPGTVMVRSVPGQADAFSPDRDVLINTQDGTVARRQGGSISDGAQVEVTFVTPPVTRDGAAVEGTVPASARPTPPMVHSVVPAYEWSQSRTGTTITSTRAGGLLRVFLNRPWLVSGVGEQLAVLVPDRDLYPGSTPEVRKLFQRVVSLSSEWGDDPVRINPGDTRNALSRGDFRLATRELIVKIPGDSRLRTRAFEHTVQYDPARQLWFADIAIGRNVYRPFVRLAVARLQINALDDLDVSSPVDVGFHELAPTRKATVELRASDASIAVTGPMSDISEFTVSLLRPGDSVGDPAVWEVRNEQQQTQLIKDSAGGKVSGTVRLPSSMPAGTRLLIREFHVLPRGTTGGEKVRRLTYFDAIAL